MREWERLVAKQCCPWSVPVCKFQATISLVFVRAGLPDNHCIFAEILICDTIPRDIIGHVQYAKLHCRLVFLCFRTKPMAAPVLQPLLLVETKTDSRCSITVADGNKDMAWSHYFNNQDRRTWNFRLNQAYLSGQLDLHRAEGFSSSNTSWLTNFVCKYNVEYGLNCKMRKAECNSQLCIWTLIIAITETNRIIYSIYSLLAFIFWYVWLVY